MMDQLISMSERLTVLLKEYKCTKEAEQFDYFIDQIEFRPSSTRERFGVIDKRTGKILCYDTLVECERYCTKRNIKAYNLSELRNVLKAST